MIVLCDLVSTGMRVGLRSQLKEQSLKKAIYISNDLPSGSSAGSRETNKGELGKFPIAHCQYDNGWFVYEWHEGKMAPVTLRSTPQKQNVDK